jgi:serine protease AprX
MKTIFSMLFFFVFVAAFSQQEDAWLFFKDKPNAATFMANPTSMLSQRAIDRRNNLLISVDEKDVPINENYISSIKNSSGITVLGKSKWLNAIHVKGEINVINTLLSSYNFIDHIEFANKFLNPNGKSKRKKVVSNHQNKWNKTSVDFNYGSANNQIKMLNGDYLHQQGLTGENQIIAVIDGGFPNVNTLAAFQRIRDHNQILGGYNFADRNSNFYTRDSHGTQVLSTIAGYIENEFVGTAPDAKFYLFITEIVESETVLEETLWVEAAEKADSLGVNVINTSLGYTTYDNENHSHSYEDMDGKTTFISRGAEIAASRGMLLVNAVGNSGNDSWKYMGAPADAPSVIAVGAVNSIGNIASFSSYGPTFDGRIKPEILAQGANAVIINHVSGAINSSNGTSFSSPIMAGLIACLNQFESQLLNSSSNSFENKNILLKKAVFESADKYSNPLNQHGYGIPNFEIALENYSNSTASIEDNLLMNLKIIPNPVKNSFNIQNLENSSTTYSLQIFNVLGKKVFEKQTVSSENIDIATLKKGIYFLKIFNDASSRTIKILKE